MNNTVEPDSHDLPDSLVCSHAAFLLDADSGSIVSASDWFCRLLGYSLAQLSGMPLCRLVVDGQEKIRVNLSYASVRGEFKGFGRRYRRRDGSCIALDVDASRIVSSSSRNLLEVFVREAGSQVDERMRAALQEWRRTVDAIAAPIFVLSPEMRILRLNSAAADYMGTDLISSVGKPFPAENWELYSTIERLMQTSLSMSAKAERREVLDGDHRYDISVSPGWDGAAVVLMTDVSESWKLQQCIKQSAVMSAMGSLLGRVAHEVRNPIFSISALLESFELTHEFDEEQKPYVEQLRSDLQRLSRLMNELLCYGKADIQRRVESDVASLIDEAVFLNRAEINARGISVHFDRKRRAIASLDRTQFVDAVRNLIENAVLHSPQGGCIQINLKFESGQMRLEVRDEGPGFSQEGLERGLDPFYSTRSGGTGLGLAVANRVVLAHGGRIELANHPDGGAVVRIVIPKTAK